MSKSITLTVAQQKINGLAEPGQSEEVKLDNALHRIAAEPMKALLPVPSFSHSTRDGFAVNRRDLQSATRSSPVELPISGEIAAGCLDIPVLQRGRAFRIMTGAAIPPGCDAVIALEEARGNQGAIQLDFTPEKRRHIRRKGHSLASGRIIARSGEELQADHLALLTTAGNQTVRVYAKPTVRVICTGTELTGSGDPLQRGQVISSNRILLASLIRDNHGTVRAASTVDDNTGKIVAELEAALRDQVDLVITTGGMGPGKFDLMARGFAELGIVPVYKSLLVRPGRATMLGVSGQTMIFALPGPPPAVRLLFNELVRPALDFMHKIYWRVETTGMENIPDYERLLLVSNLSPSSCCPSCCSTCCRPCWRSSWSRSSSGSYSTGASRR